MDFDKLLCYKFYCCFFSDNGYKTEDEEHDCIDECTHFIFSDNEPIFANFIRSELPKNKNVHTYNDVCKYHQFVLDNFDDIPYSRKLFHLLEYFGPYDDDDSDKRYKEFMDNERNNELELDEYDEREMKHWDDYSSKEFDYNTYNFTKFISLFPGNFNVKLWYYKPLNNCNCSEDCMNENHYEKVERVYNLKEEEPLIKFAGKMY